MFTFNPDLARDDNVEDGDEAFDTTNLPVDEEEDDMVIEYIFAFSTTDIFCMLNINVFLMLQEYRELDLNALACAPTSVDGSGTVAPAAREYQVESETKNGDAECLDEAAGGVPIDENLFADEDDLDDLEDELEDLDVND